MEDDSEFMFTNDEKIEITKSNIVLMLHNRGFINKNNIESKRRELINTDINDIYVLNVDNNKNYNTELLDGKIVIKYYDYVITSSSKNSEISEFINKNMNVHKIIVVKDFVIKSVKTLKMGKHNLEIFSYDNLVKNTIEHVSMPKYYVYNQEERDKMLFDYNALVKDMPTIYTTDGIALYYGLKVGDVVRETFGTLNGESVFYRAVIFG